MGKLIPHTLKTLSISSSWEGVSSAPRSHSASRSLQVLTGGKEREQRPAGGLSRARSAGMRVASIHFLLTTKSCDPA